MKSLIGTGALALTLLLTGCGGESGGGGNKSGGSSAPAAAVAPPANGDWTQTVVETPEGGFQVGNPAAAVKLVEYASATCPHCAKFSEEASAPLMNDYVKTGQVSYEFRHLLMFPTDPGVSLLARCQGPAPFFHLTEQLYADQANWSAKVRELPPAEMQRLQALPPQQQAGQLIKSAGIDQFFRQRGIPQAKIDACLTDPQGLQKLVDLSTRAQQEGVQSTPTFFINGERAENAGTWSDLQPLLNRALGR